MYHSYLNDFNVDITIFMLLSVESHFIDYYKFIDFIDHNLSHDFTQFPILMDLSLSKSKEEFIKILTRSRIEKSKVDFNHLLLGFIMISYKENKISINQYKQMVLEVFDTQHMDFSIEDISLFFENDETIYTKVNQLFLECEQKAKKFIYDFEKNMTDITSHIIKFI